jgi:uncharacterized protein (DUF58 family)
LLKYFEALKSRSNPAEHSRSQKSVRRFFPYTFKITREGFLFLLCVFVLSLAAINSGNNLLFIILASLLSAIVVSGIISRNSLRQVSLSLQLPENVFVGDIVSIKVTMKNLKRIFPSFSIRVEDSNLNRERSLLSRIGKRIFRSRHKEDETGAENRAMFRQAAYFPILRAGEIRSELTTQSFPRRGLYSLQGFTVSTRFPFGLFRRGEYIGAKGEILVYPLTQEVSSFFHLLPFLPGHLEGHHVGLGENLFSIRKYQEGENARIIDWKASAKTGELMAREFAREEESKLCLILDTGIDTLAKTGMEKNFEKAVSLAAGITAHFLGEGASLEYLTPEEYIPRGTGTQQLYRILRSLAVVQYETTPPASPSELWSFRGFPAVTDAQALRLILSDKSFKIIISSKPRGSFPSAVWRSSHVVFFDEL